MKIKGVFKKVGVFVLGLVVSTLLPESIRPYAMILSIVLVLIWAVWPYLKRQSGKLRNIVPVAAIGNDKHAKTMINLFNALVTQSLARAYPDASWEWCAGPNAAMSVLSGEDTGRIRLQNAGKNNYALVRCDPSCGRLIFKMIQESDWNDLRMRKKKKAVQEEAALEEEAVEEPSPVEKWFIANRDILLSIITDAQNDGAARIKINRKGEVYQELNGNAKAVDRLTDFPKAADWVELTRIWCAYDCYIEKDWFAVEWDNEEVPA